MNSVASFEATTSTLITKIISQYFFETLSKFGIVCVNFVEEEEDKLKVKSGFVSANFEEENFAKLFEVEVLPLLKKE